MSDIRKLADRYGRMLAEEKIEKYSFTLSESEKQELNVENGSFKLMRTVFNNSGSLTVFAGARTGSASGNDITEEGLQKLIGDAKAAAESSPEDPCHDIAPDQGKNVFRQGTQDADLDGFVERIREFRIMAAIGSFDKWHWLSRNTNGTEFEGFGGQYGFMIEICASDGEKTTGLDYTGVSIKSLDKPLIEIGEIRKKLEDIQNSIYPDTLEGKFEGTVILTPGCASEFLYMLLQNYCGSHVIMDGTSLWLDKVGEQVADEKLTVALKPYDDRIINGERGTNDGYLSEDVTIIDKGVLKTHWLNLYAANKTGRPVVQNTGFDVVVGAGDTALADIIAGVDRGLILGGFSGGTPGTNGEFSGVAKNSFLIENGKIKNAVTETMVNGNLGGIVKKIRAISKELCVDGGMVMPYIAVEGIVISGK